MNDQTPPGWGARRPWICLGQIAPSDVKPGDLVRSDLIVRADHLEISRRLGRPDYYPHQQWTIGDASAFMEKLPSFNGGTHMVATWYRVWQGPRPDGFELDASLSDEERRKVLTDLHDRQEQEERRKALEDVDVEELLRLLTGSAEADRVP